MSASRILNIPEIFFHDLQYFLGMKTVTDPSEPNEDSRQICPLPVSILCQSLPVFSCSRSPACGQQPSSYGGPSASGPCSANESLNWKVLVTLDQHETTRVKYKDIGKGLQEHQFQNKENPKMFSLKILQE